MTTPAVLALRIIWGRNYASFAGSQEVDDTVSLI
jgi:hypothetical protein